MSQIELNFVLASNEPYQLSKFYEVALSAELKPGFNDQHFWITHPNGTKIQIYRSSLSRPFPLRGRNLAMCLVGQASLDPLSNLEDWVQRLVSMGATVVESCRLESFGAEVWMADPEGNEFLLLLPFLK